VLVIDEAYFEYCQDDPDYPDSLAVLAAQSRPWIVLRTFSKAYGLAGLRVGYGLASHPELVNLLNRVRTPFNINRAAQAAAVAAIGDQAHVKASVALVNAQRERMAADSGAGFYVAPSHANFSSLTVDAPAARWRSICCAMASSSSRGGSQAMSTGSGCRLATKRITSSLSTP
jgi:histidinol-phosphate aminotransferase